MVNPQRIASVRGVDESSAAFAAFGVYRKMPAGERTLARVAEELGKSEGIIRRWSAKHGWIQRCRDYDDAIEQRDAEVEEEVARTSAKRHISQAQRLQGIAMGELERLAEFSQDSEIPLLRPTDAIKMVEVGFKMERLASGETTERSDQITTARPLTREEMAQFNDYLDTKSSTKEDDLDVDFG